MSVLAIITARGGSKRIPKKNIKQFCGEPIISYSIKSAINSGIFDEIMVSTDDDEIAKISLSYGAKIPFIRSADTSSDFATTSDVILEVIMQYKNRGKEFDYICCIYPTAPFITSDKLIEAYKIIQEPNVNSVLPVVKYSYPPQRSLEINNGNLYHRYPEHINTRSQDLTSVYHDAGQFYFLDKSYFLEEKKIIGNYCKPIIVSELEVQDIDSGDDWVIAEMKYALMQNRIIEDEN